VEGQAGAPGDFAAPGEGGAGDATTIPSTESLTSGEAAEPASTTPDTTEPEPADAPALGESEASANASEGGSVTGSVENSTSTAAPPVPQSTLEPPPQLEPANDNSIPFREAEPLPATGTE
jgi:hypothetical protein